jgi:hypothetical protein
VEGRGEVWVVHGNAPRSREVAKNVSGAADAAARRLGADALGHPRLLSSGL